MSQIDSRRGDIRRHRDGRAVFYTRPVPGGSMHVAGFDDDSPLHHTYPTGYNPSCGMCWLGHSHSERYHVEALGTLGEYNAPTVPATRGNVPGDWDGRHFTPCSPGRAHQRRCSTFVENRSLWDEVSAVGIVEGGEVTWRVAR